MKEKSLVIDSSAVIAFLKDEPSALQVEQYLKDAINGKINLAIPLVNYGEVIYVLMKYLDLDESLKARLQFESLGIEIVPIDDEATIAAAEFKAQGGISYLDGFVLALAQKRGIGLITLDREYGKFKNLVRIYNV